jgi:hypothetical protein
MRCACICHQVASRKSPRALSRRHQGQLSLALKNSDSAAAAADDDDDENDDGESDDEVVKGRAGSESNESVKHM